MGSWSGPPTRRTVPASPASRGRGSRSASRSSGGRAGECRSRRRGRARRSRSCRAARWGGSTGRPRAPYMCTRPPLVAPHTSPSRRLRTFPFPVAPTRANVDGRRLPAATTRRDPAHDPARGPLDQHPRSPPPRRYRPRARSAPRGRPWEISATPTSRTIRSGSSDPRAPPVAGPPISPPSSAGPRGPPR